MKPSVNNIMRNPILGLDFNFDYHRPEGEWRMIEQIRLVAAGGPLPQGAVECEVIPDRLLHVEVWIAILGRALKEINLPEVAHELEACFSQEAIPQAQGA